MKRRLLFEEHERQLRLEILGGKNINAGAVVKRPFSINGRRADPGTLVSKEEIAAMPRANFDVMVGAYFTLIPEAAQ